MAGERIDRLEQHRQDAEGDADGEQPDQPRADPARAGLIGELRGCQAEHEGQRIDGERVTVVNIAFAVATLKLRQSWCHLLFSPA